MGHLNQGLMAKDGYAGSGYCDTTASSCLLCEISVYWSMCKLKNMLRIALSGTSKQLVTQSQQESAIPNAKGLV